jgi:hypothetical protein
LFTTCAPTGVIVGDAAPTRFVNTIPVGVQAVLLVVTHPGLIVHTLPLPSTPIANGSVSVFPWVASCR